MIENEEGVMVCYDESSDETSRWDDDTEYPETGIIIEWEDEE